MPMVGIGIALVIFAANGSVIASSTTEKAPGLAHDARVLLDRRPLVATAPLRAEAAQHVDRLRRQPDVGHDGNAAIGEKADGLRHAPAALELDRAALGFLDDLSGIVEGVARALLIGAEGHVDDDERVLGAAHDGAAMHDHEVERHRQCRFEAVHHHAEGVADQQEVDIFVGDGRGMGVIGGERHDRLAALAPGDIGRRQSLRGGMGGHGNNAPLTARTVPP